MECREGVGGREYTDARIIVFCGGQWLVSRFGGFAFGGTVAAYPLARRPSVDDVIQREILPSSGSDLLPWGLTVHT
jgi:hypothetical protein